MEIQILLSVIAGAASIVGMVGGLLAVRDKANAERAFERVLMTHARSLREIRDRSTDSGVVTPAALEELVACFEVARRALPTKQRRLIASGLHQRSLRGRARYVAKVMNKIGVGSGRLPIAVPDSLARL